MPAPATSPAARLKVLARAKKRLADIPRGELFTSMPMADLLEISWVTLKKWCNEFEGFAESGAFSRGDRGMNWDFCPVRTVWFLIEYFEAMGRKAAEKSAKTQKDTGIELPESEETVTFEEARGLVNLTITVTSAAEKQGIYCLASETADFIDGYNQTVINSILGVRTTVDPGGLLPPREREAMDEALRGVAAHVHEQAQKFIKGCRAGIQQAGTAGAGEPAGKPPVLPKRSRSRRKAA